MKLFLALAGFTFVLLFGSAISDNVQIIKVDVGSREDFEGEYIDGKVKRCTIEQNDGKVSEFYPNNESIGESNVYGNRCKLTVWDMKLEYAGVWILTTVTDNDQSIQTKFEVTMVQNGFPKPSNRIQAANGEWITVWLDKNNTDITECKLKATMEEKVYDLLEGPTGNLSRYQACGVRMPADKKYERQWELTRRIGKYVIEHAIFHISVTNKDQRNLQVMKLVWNLGEAQILRVGEGISVVFCQFVRPDGTLTKIQYGSCTYEISVVTEFHQGIWRASYASIGSIELNHVEIFVETWDLTSLTAKQLPGNGQEINLLCRTGMRVLKFCSFISPEKHVISLPVGVGNENYTYYGDGYLDDMTSRRYADCGVTIHKPTESDYGLWSCEMGVVKNDKVVIRGTVIDVVKKRAARTYKINNPSVTVKNGDSFKIRCTVNAVLDYCWLTSPNGTVYSISPETDSHSILKYDGKGYAMGDCSAIVKRANLTDSGDWSCHLGISGGNEIEEKVTVRVTDSYLVPMNKKVYETENPKLACHNFLGEDGTLQYCRWVRPNGHGINENDAWRYETTTGIDKCELTILEIEPDDFGQWTCVAMLTGATREEQSATIEFVSVRGELATTSIISIILGSALLIIALMGSFFAAVYIYRRRKLQGEIKSPPPYDPEDYEIPRVIQTASNEPTSHKDYRY